MVEVSLDRHEELEPNIGTTLCLTKRAMREVPLRHLVALNAMANGNDTVGKIANFLGYSTSSARTILSDAYRNPDFQSLFHSSSRLAKSNLFVASIKSGYILPDYLAKYSTFCDNYEFGWLDDAGRRATDAESRILGCLFDGITSRKQLADALGLKPATVRSQIFTLYNKFGYKAGDADSRNLTGFLFEMIREGNIVVMPVQETWL